jgi:hypothetical protein
MSHHLFAATARGAAAGMIASVVQAAVGALESATFVPDGENANIAPRLMARLADGVGGSLNAVERWTLGTAYHVLYGAGWGAAYALVRERTSVPPLIGGALLGATIYTITFPRYGGAVLLDVEREPGERSREMEVVLASVTASFGLTVAAVYERLRGRPMSRRRGTVR